MTLPKLTDKQRNLLQECKWDEPDKFICCVLRDCSAFDLVTEVTSEIRQYWIEFKPDAYTPGYTAFINAHCRIAHPDDYNNQTIKHRQAFVAWLLENY